jgi:pseudouridine synthase
MDERSGERLHKVLARYGIASRRDCEDLIRQGRIKIDGKVITEMGVRVDPELQVVSFDDAPVRLEEKVYILAYKPKGVVCTTDDQFGRPSIVDLVGPAGGARLFPVGRMEEDSEGLILLTNDGEFANLLVKRRTPLRHVYFLRVRGSLSQEALEKVRQGIWLSDGRTGPMFVKVLRWGKQASTLLVSPTAQQHRTLRRAFAKVGVIADRVVRTRIGPLNTDHLKRGTWRRLVTSEVDALRNPAVEDVMPVFQGESRWTGSAATRPERPRRSGERPSRGAPKTRGARGPSQRTEGHGSDRRRSSDQDRSGRPAKRGAGKGGATSRPSKPAPSPRRDEAAPTRRRILGP